MSHGTTRILARRRGRWFQVDVGSSRTPPRHRANARLLLRQCWSRQGWTVRRSRVVPCNHAEREQSSDESDPHDRQRNAGDCHAATTALTALRSTQTAEPQAEKRQPEQASSSAAMENPSVERVPDRPRGPGSGEGAEVGAGGVSGMVSTLGPQFTRSHPLLVRRAADGGTLPGAIHSLPACVRTDAAGRQSGTSRDCRAAARRPSPCRPP